MELPQRQSLVSETGARHEVPTSRLSRMSRALRHVRRTEPYYASARGTECEDIHRSSASHCIVLVHGFRGFSGFSSSKGSKVLYKNALERWYDENKSKNKEREVYMTSFKFSMEKVLKGTRGIPEESARLKDLLTQILTNQAPNATCSCNEVAKSPESEGRKYPIFILIGYNLGSWVVRDLVWRYRHESIIVNTLSTISLDALEIFEGREILSYIKFLQQTQKKFFMGEKFDVSNNLPEELQGIDARFKSDLPAFSEKNFVYKIADFHKNVWMGEGSQDRSMSRSQRNRSLLTKPVTREDYARGLLDTLDGQIEYFLASAAAFKINRPLVDHRVEGLREPIPEGISRRTEQRDNTALPVFERLPPDMRFGNNTISDQSTYETTTTYMDTDVDRILHLAAEYIDKGDFHHAEVLLTKGEELCQKELLTRQSLSPLREETLDLRVHSVQLHRIVINMHLGQYPETISQLQALLETLREKDGPEYRSLKVDVRKWLSYSLGLNGQYKQSVYHYQKLLDYIMEINDCHDCVLETMIVEIHRELAMLYAYLGQFNKSTTALLETRRIMEASFPMPQGTSNSEKEEKKQQTCLESKAYLVMAEAKVLLLLGKYSEGLLKAEEAFRRMTQQFGWRHIKTLESGRVKAKLQALTSNALGAEKTCREILSSMRSELGKDHPLTLETMLLLAFIFRYQTRLVESLDLAYSVCSVLEGQLGKSHPATLEAMEEVAASHCSTGNYASASEILRELVQQSQREFTWSHPNVMRYLSQTAYVYSLSGHSDAAETLALVVLQKQWTIYDPEEHSAHNYPRIYGDAGTQLEKDSTHDFLISSNVALSADSKPEAKTASHTKDIITHVLDKIKYSLQTGEHRSCSEKGQIRIVNLSSLMMHPHLLCTLEILAHIEMEKKETDLLLVDNILTCTASWHAQTLGPLHSSTLYTEFQLAFVKRARKQLREARDQFLMVFTERQKACGNLHPLTLIALRESLSTECALEPAELSNTEVKLETKTKVMSITVDTIGKWNTQVWSDANSQDLEGAARVEAVSRAILTYQEEKLGKLHPEVLNTLLWILFLHLDITARQSDSPTVKRQTSNLAEDIMHRTNDSAVLTERGYMSLQLQRTVVRFYELYDLDEDARIIKKCTNHTKDLERDYEQVNDLVKKYCQALAGTERENAPY